MFHAGDKFDLTGRRVPNKMLLSCTSEYYELFRYYLLYCLPPSLDNLSVVVWMKWNWLNLFYLIKYKNTTFSTFTLGKHVKCEKQFFFFKLFKSKLKIQTGCKYQSCHIMSLFLLKSWCVDCVDFCYYYHIVLGIIMIKGDCMFSLDKRSRPIVSQGHFVAWRWIKMRSLSLFLQPPRAAGQRNITLILRFRPHFYYHLNTIWRRPRFIISTWDS